MFALPLPLPTELLDLSENEANRALSNRQKFSDRSSRIRCGNALRVKNDIVVERKMVGEIGKH